MKAIIAALIITFLTSCASKNEIEAPRTYSKMNERDNIGEVVDDMHFQWEKAMHSIEYSDKNPLDVLFYPFKKDGVRDGLVLWYK